MLVPASASRPHDDPNGSPLAGLEKFACGRWPLSAHRRTGRSGRATPRFSAQTSNGCVSARSSRQRERFLLALIAYHGLSAPPPPARLTKRSGARDARHQEEPRPRTRAARRVRRCVSLRTGPQAHGVLDRIRVGLAAGTVGAAILGGCYFIFSFCVMDALNQQGPSQAIAPSVKIIVSPSRHRRAASDSR